MKVLKLTELEYKILKEHWNRNLHYGPGGTFGNGEDLVIYDDEFNDIPSTREYNVGKRIADKIAKLN